MLPPLTAAQSVPPTVAQPPRMPLVLDAVVVMAPLPPGSVKFTVPPSLRPMAPRASVVPLPPLLATVTAELPAATVVPLNVCELVPAAAPSSKSEPPLRMRAEPALTRLVGAAMLLMLRARRRR